MKHVRPQDRKLLFDLLRPPPGYRLDTVIGTTYSLDLLALLVTPLAFTLFDWEAKDGRITTSPYALLESLRRYADQTHIFCQAGQIHVPKKNRRLFSYLERSVLEVTPANPNGVFHPKLWLLRFQPAERASSADWPIVYRLLCPSRNITFDRSWDTMLALEGELHPRGRRLEEMEPLCGFIARLPEYAVRTVPERVGSDVNRIAEELHRVTFELPQGFDELRFWPLGMAAHAVWPFPEEMDYIMIISPFLDDKLLRRLTKREHRGGAWSRGPKALRTSPMPPGSGLRTCTRSIQPLKRMRKTIRRPMIPWTSPRVMGPPPVRHLLNQPGQLLLFSRVCMPRPIWQTSVTQEGSGLGRLMPLLQRSARTSSFSSSWPAQIANAASTRYSTPMTTPSGTYCKRTFHRPSHVPRTSCKRNWSGDCRTSSE